MSARLYCRTSAHSYAPFAKGPEPTDGSSQYVVARFDQHRSLLRLRLSSPDDLEAAGQTETRSDWTSTRQGSSENDCGSATGSLSSIVGGMTNDDRQANRDHHRGRKRNWRGLRPPAGERLSHRRDRLRCPSSEGSSEGCRRMRLCLRCGLRGISGGLHCNGCSQGSRRRWATSPPL
jgi:hypothetical protein